MYLLALGLGLGCGWGCGSLSTPFMTSYIVGHELNVKNGLKSMLIFSIGKILSMIILAIIVSLLSINFLSDTTTFLGFKLTTFFDVFMIGMGVIIIHRSIKAIRGKKSCSTCNVDVNTIDVIKHDLKVEKEGTNKKDLVILFISGIFYGITPCIPLITILSICSTMTVLNSILLMSFFGIITCISPTITNSIIASIMNREMKRDLKGSIKFIQLAIGIFLIGFGLLPLI